MRVTRNIHVVKAIKRGWAVRAACRARATSVHSTKAQAVKAARAIAARRGVWLYVHRKDGSVQRVYGGRAWKIRPESVSPP